MRARVPDRFSPVTCPFPGLHVPERDPGAEVVTGAEHRVVAQGQAADVEGGAELERIHPLYHLGIGLTR